MARSKYCFVGVIALVLGLAAFSASADSALVANVVKADRDGGPALSTVVAYRDLNLASTAGVAALYHRIANAADVVCTPFSGRRDLAMRIKLNDCREGAIGRAVASVANPLLTDYVASLQGRASPTLVAAR